MNKRMKKLDFIKITAQQETSQENQNTDQEKNILGEQNLIKDCHPAIQTTLRTQQ